MNDARRRFNMWRAFGKRAFDIVVAAVLIVVTIPIVVVVAFLVRIKIGSPVFFVQERPGLRGVPFLLIKFRTMRRAVGENGQLLPDEQRMTPLGVRLRAWSLDELPELWNVMRGEMSLVGPRPLLMEYLPLYTTEQMRRHDVLPGITGLAQVAGRNSLSWEDKFSFDLRYVDTMSMWLDIKILFLTALQVVTRRGITQEGHVTSERFRP